jgi:hypothetical protein
MVLVQRCASPAIARADIAPKAAIVSICGHARLAADALQGCAVSSHDQPRSTRGQLYVTAPACPSVSAHDLNIGSATDLLWMPTVARSCSLHDIRTWPTVGSQ